jgi:excisionase family DNA binding protein
MKVFTTGKVAKICRVSTRTVSGWIDSGLLKGYRLPGSQDRRVIEMELLKFLEKHGMPTDLLEESDR